MRGQKNNPQTEKHCLAVSQMLPPSRPLDTLCMAMSWKCSYMNKDPKEIINCLPWTKFHQKLFTNCLSRWQKSKDTDTMKVLEIDIYCSEEDRHQRCILCQILAFNAKVITVKSLIFLGRSLPRITRHIFFVASLYPISPWISSSLSSLSSNSRHIVTIVVIKFSV